MKRRNRLGLKEKFSFLAIMTYNREIEKNVLLKKKIIKSKKVGEC
jgi:hypothetical protein